MAHIKLNLLTCDVDDLIRAVVRSRAQIGNALDKYAHMERTQGLTRTERYNKMELSDEWQRLLQLERVLSKSLQTIDGQN